MLPFSIGEQMVIFLHFATYLSKNYVKMVDKQILFSNQRVFRQIGTHNYILELAFISNIALSFFFVISVNSQTTQYDLMLLLTWLFHIKSNMAPLLVFLFQKSTKVFVDCFENKYNMSFSATIFFHISKPFSRKYDKRRLAPGHSKNMYNIWKFFFFQIRLTFIGDKRWDCIFELWIKPEGM